MAERLIAKKNIYAEVEEDGGKVNRLVAAAGQPVPAGYRDLVKDGDVTTDIARTRVASEDVYADVEEYPGTSVHRKVAAAGQPVPAEYADQVGGKLAEEVEHEPGASRQRVATAAAAGAGSEKTGTGKRRSR